MQGNYVLANSVIEEYVKSLDAEGDLASIVE